MLRIDADERLTDAVKREAAPLLASPRAEGIHGITMEATFYLLGRAIRHGGAKKRKLMFFRFGSGRVEDRFMDEHTLRTQGRAAQLRARFDHYDFKSIDHFAQKLNWYATREVMDILRADLNADRVSDSHIRRTRRLKGGVYYRFPMFLRAFAVFFVRYILQLGFLDGKEGLIYHFMYSCMYRFLVDAKLHEAKRRDCVRTDLNLWTPDLSPKEAFRCAFSTSLPSRLPATAWSCSRWTARRRFWNAAFPWISPR